MSAGGRYRLVSYGRAIPGAAASYEVTISAVAKENGSGAPYCVPNELICSAIGQFLNLPLPPAGIVEVSGTSPKSLFASLDFNLTGNALPPVNPDDCIAAMPKVSTGVLLFDVLVANSDRHAGNLHLDLSGHSPRMSVFDHSHALLGWTLGQAHVRLNNLRDRLGVTSGFVTQGNRHCFLDKVSDQSQFSHWLDRIAAIPDFLISDACRDAVGLGIDPNEADLAIDFLRHRRDNIRDIVQNHKSEFTGVSQWALFP